MTDDTINLLISIGATLAKIVVLTHTALILAMYMPWVERKVSAWIQDRVGPNRVGWAGLLQPIADTVKFLFKEDVTPGHVNKFLFVLSPCLAVMPALFIMAVIPFGPPVQVFGQSISLVIADLGVGILFVFAFSSLAVYGVTFAGWASNSKYPLLGGIRASAQMISYEICLGLSVVGVFMMSESLRLLDVVAVQMDGTWNIFTQPLGLLIFTIAAFAETNRLPFDMPEAETELVAGYHTEYSSIKFTMFFAGEYVSMFVFSALFAVLFLGGWDLPFMDSASWAALGNWGAPLGFAVFLAKCLCFLMLFVWVRFTIPRFRFDQLMHLGWKVLIPLALLNILITGLFNLPGAS